MTSVNLSFSKIRQAGNSNISFGEVITAPTIVIISLPELSQLQDVVASQNQLAIISLDVTPILGMAIRQTSVISLAQLTIINIDRDTLNLQANIKTNGLTASIYTNILTASIYEE